MRRGSHWILSLAALLGASMIASSACVPSDGAAAGQAPSGGAAGGEGARTGEGSTAGERGLTQGGAGGSGEAGAAPGGQAVGGAAGDASGGEASAPGEGPFTGMDPFPCDSDEALPVSFDADCAPDGEWGSSAEVACDALPGARLIGVTPDELTLVWSEAEGSEVLYYLADRGAVDEPFGVAQQVSGVHVLAVSPDGLRLIALSSDHSALLALTRADRADAFDAATQGEFAELDGDASEKGWSFSSAVLSPDDRTLFYTVGDADAAYPLRVSTRSAGGPWPLGEALEQCEFEAHSGYGRYPTGMSSDGKTLFFHDSWRGRARAAWRDTDTAAFTWFRDTGDWLVAQPNAACDRLYHSVADPTARLLVAPAE